MELSFNFIAVIFITIRALAKSKIITYVRGKLKNLHDEIKCFSGDDKGIYQASGNLVEGIEVQL